MDILNALEAALQGASLKAFIDESESLGKGLDVDSARRKKRDEQNGEHGKGHEREVNNGPGE